MPLETATYVTDLVASNPAHTDGLSQADSHMRLMKSCLKATFPNFSSAALNSTQAALDAAATAGALISISHGQLRGPGLTTCGQFGDFAKVPSSRFTSAGVAAGGQAAVDWIECDGNTTYLIADYPDLAAFLGTTYGGNGTTTFGVPNLKDTGRFRRSRTGSVAVGTYQANQNLSHTHTFTGTGGTDTQGAHNHNISVSITDPGHSHTYTGLAVGSGNATLASGNANNTSLNTGTSFTGISATGSSDTQGNHSHNVTVSGTTAATGGASEARPESLVVVMCIKT